jgi:hypothetical protein
MRLNSKLFTTFTIGVGAVALALLSVESANAQMDRKPTWSAELHLKDKKEIAIRLREPVLERAQPQRVKLTNGKASREIGNCDEYLNAVGAGFHPATNFDGKISASFVYECFVLRDLQHAGPATSTSSYQWSSAALTQLPPVLVPGAKEITDSAERAEKRGESWKQFNPSLRIEKITSDQLLAEDDDMFYTLEILARADFDGDGVEDVAVYGSAYGKHSTWAHPEYFIFSPAANGKLTRLTHSRAPYRMKMQIPGVSKRTDFSP